VKTQIDQAMLDWKLLTFRDQNLTDEHQIAFSRQLGRPCARTWASPDRPTASPCGANWTRKSGRERGGEATRAGFWT
jgi:alpha-ketoglutarate-dependent taurine dioxygenase